MLEPDYLPLAREAMDKVHGDRGQAALWVRDGGNAVISYVGPWPPIST